jgi:hypothetical protein
MPAPTRQVPIGSADTSRQLVSDVLGLLVMDTSFFLPLFHHIPPNSPTYLISRRPAGSRTKHATGRRLAVVPLFPASSLPSHTLLTNI